jgi:hypothetical protein
VKLWRWDLIFIFCVLFVACPLDNCESGAGPSPIPTTTTTVEPEPPPLPPRVDVRANLYDVRGCTAFGAAALTEPELTAFIYHGLAGGCNMFRLAGGCNMFRVGAQTDGWAGHEALYLAASAGPKVFTPEWENAVRRLLDVSSRIPGVYLQLIPTFTHKHQGDKYCMKLTREVVKIQQAGSDDDPTPYKHIVWEAYNEYRHPIATVTERGVADILRYLKSSTDLPVGTDSSGGRRGKWVGEYPRSLLPLVDYVAFHPPRNDWHGDYCKSIRPDYWALRKTVNSYGKPVWFDEPIMLFAAARRKTPARNSSPIICGMSRMPGACGLFECRRLGWLPQ